MHNVIPVTATVITETMHNVIPVTATVITVSYKTGLRKIMKPFET